MKENHGSSYAKKDQIEAMCHYVFPGPLFPSSAIWVVPVSLGLPCALPLAKPLQNASPEDGCGGKAALPGTTRNYCRQIATEPDRSANMRAMRSNFGQK